MHDSDTRCRHDRQLLRPMLLSRRFKEKSAELYTLGKIQGFLYPYIDEEAVAVGRTRSMDFLNVFIALHKKVRIDIPEKGYPKLATL